MDTRVHWGASLLDIFVCSVPPSQRLQNCNDCVANSNFYLNFERVSLDQFCSVLFKVQAFNERIWKTILKFCYKKQQIYEVLDKSERNWYNNCSFTEAVRIFYSFFIRKLSFFYIANLVPVFCLGRARTARPLRPGCLRA